MPNNRNLRPQQDILTHENDVKRKVRPHLENFDPRWYQGLDDTLKIETLATVLQGRIPKWWTQEDESGKIASSWHGIKTSFIQNSPQEEKPGPSAQTCPVFLKE
jgi:hypothetical protein